MKLPQTEQYIKEGIKMKKLVQPAVSGFFYYRPALYDKKTVYDLDEAVDLSNNGWRFEAAEEVFANITLHLYRDLKDKK